MGNIISNIIFYAIWLPICLLLMGGVMLWAILITCFIHIIHFIKKYWMLILFFGFIFGLPMYAYYSVSSGHFFQERAKCEQCTIESLEKIKAKLKAENKIRVEKNKKALHDGTYKPKKWAGWPWDRE